MTLSLVPSVGDFPRTGESGERDRDRDRERDSVFRIRERRWMDSAPKEDGSGASRADKAEGFLGADGKKKSPSNALMFVEELQFWCGKVRELQV